MIKIDEAVQRAIDTHSNLYNMKSNCPDNQRDAELRNLYELAALAPDGAAAEIGVKRGGSFLCWACAREGRGNLYAIDDWSMKTEGIFWDNCRLYNVAVEVLGMQSVLAAEHVQEPLAFVFVDGSHDIGILDDIKLWPPKIMPGGIIAFHDYGTWKTSVKVKEMVDGWYLETRWDKFRQVGSTAAFMRPRDG